MRLRALLLTGLLLAPVAGRAEDVAALPEHFSTAPAFRDTSRLELRRNARTVQRRSVAPRGPSKPTKRSIRIRRQRAAKPNRRLLQTGSSVLAQLRDEVFRLTNAARKEEGLHALTRNTLLEDAAQKHAEDMVNEEYFSHDSEDGRTYAQRIQATGYVGIGNERCRCTVRAGMGENLARGQTTAAQAVADWLKSPPHRENLLSTDFKEVGIGVFGNVWVQDFGYTEIIYRRD